MVVGIKGLLASTWGFQGGTWQERLLKRTHYHKPYKEIEKSQEAVLTMLFPACGLLLNLLRLYSLSLFLKTITLIRFVLRMCCFTRSTTQYCGFSPQWCNSYLSFSMFLKLIDSFYIFICLVCSHLSLRTEIIFISTVSSTVPGT